MDEQIVEVINDLRNSVKGLRLEVEAWRVHVSSGNAFMLGEIDHLITVIDKLQRSIR